MPVRPTVIVIASSFVCASRALNLYAIAQRGSRPAAPSRSCIARLVHFNDDAVDFVVQFVALHLPRAGNTR